MTEKQLQRADELITEEIFLEAWSIISPNTVIHPKGYIRSKKYRLSMLDTMVNLYHIKPSMLKNELRELVVVRIVNRERETLEAEERIKERNRLRQIEQKLRDKQFKIQMILDGIRNIVEFIIAIPIALVLGFILYSIPYILYYILVYSFGD